jgi:hypothetical protein
MTDAVEHDVISLLGQDDAPARQLGPEPAADQDDRRRSPLLSDPFFAPFAALVIRPFDLHGRAVPDVAGQHEVTQYPPAAVLAIYLGIPGIDPICHGERR